MPVHEFRAVLRNLLKHPAAALTVIPILAVALGANTALFSLVDAVLLRPLPYGDADRLVEIRAVDIDGTPQWNAFPDLEDWQTAGSIAGVVGATLSARAAADSVRRMLAYWEVLLRPAEVESPVP